MSLSFPISPPLGRPPRLRAVPRSLPGPDSGILVVAVPDIFRVLFAVPAVACVWMRGSRSLVGSVLSPFPPYRSYVLFIFEVLLWCFVARTPFGLLCRAAPVRERGAEGWGTSL